MCSGSRNDRHWDGSLISQSFQIFDLSLLSSRIRDLTSPRLLASPFWKKQMISLCGSGNIPSNLLVSVDQNLTSHRQNRFCNKEMATYMLKQNWITMLRQTTQTYHSSHGNHGGASVRDPRTSSSGGGSSSSSGSGRNGIYWRLQEISNISCVIFRLQPHAADNRSPNYYLRQRFWCSGGIIWKIFICS